MGGVECGGGGCDGGVRGGCVQGGQVSIKSKSGANAKDPKMKAGVVIETFVSSQYHL